VSRAGLRPLTSYAVRVDPEIRIDNLFAAFVQDEISLTRSVFLTVGTKFDHNAYAGFGLEPSLQLVWTATDRTSFWASAGRAIRQPSHLEYGAHFNEAVVDVPGVGAAVVSLIGNPHLRAEHLNDYEAGYRGQLSSGLSLDATAFLSYYDRLQTYEPQAPVFTVNGGGPLLTLPLQFANLGHARDYGVELFGHWKINRHWEISPGYSLLRMKTGTAPASGDTFLALAPGSSPQHQPQIRSQVNLRKNVEWDSSAKYVSALPSLHVSGYLRVDARLGWRLGESFEISLIGQDLTRGRHLEFVDLSGLFIPTEVSRSVFTRFTWRF
jgi:iron complex outermembrane recepter protein